LSDDDRAAYQVAGTAVGAVSSAVAVHVAGRRWLSFFRYVTEKIQSKKPLKEISKQNLNSPTSP